MSKGPLYFILAILMLPLSAFAQNDYHNGYIITIKNDTIEGRVKDRKSPPFGRLYKKIRFKRKNIFARKYEPDKILGYKQGDNQYETRWIEVSNSFFRETYSSIPNSGERHFFKVVIRGYLTYYQWEYEDGESDYISSIDLFKREDEPVLTRVTQGIFGLKKKKLAKYFGDCPELVAKIQNKEFKDPVEVINFYNEWKARNPY